MKILGLIPARGGSKGIPGKNIKLLNGKPLLAYTFESAQKSSLLSKTILSSDDAEIIQTAQELGLEVPFVRPADLADDKSPTLPVIQHALRFFLEKGENFDAVCLLQTTYPFRASGLIDKAIEKFIQMDADALISVLPVPHEFNPHWVFEPDNSGLLNISTGEKKIISRRQDLPPAYIRDGAIYLTKAKTLLEEGSLYGDSLTYFETDPSNYVNLDTFQDWQKAEELVLRLSPKI
ncbi:acylneuraminate cytidylyltransferase family protein [Algoriphagus marincola]|uniref:acylneuraminate cytidylyltransferase family protein n=1 Tax=Algoriphagus marincola TaxID=264027 RepID=UPI0004129208|nr:acylneuraminate cytidylyltransferase family protein [Algoriphagus marincola]